MDFLGLVIPTRIGEYLIAAVVIILAPGPSVLFVIARAIAWGRRVAVLTVLGNSSGALVLSIIVALGFGPLLSRSELLYAAVQWGGGLYLLFLGIDAWRKRTAHAADMSVSQRHSTLSVSTRYGRNRHHDSWHSCHCNCCS